MVVLKPQRFLITRRKVAERFAKMWRKQWLQIRNDSPLLILLLGERVSKRGCWVKWVGEIKTCSRESVAKGLIGKRFL